MKKTACLLCLAVAAASLPAVAETVTPPAVVARVDVPRYMGVWHEISRLPMKFQNACAGEVTANYTLNADGSVNVLNRCRKNNGEMMQAKGLARAVDKTGSKLRVTFLPEGLRWLPVGRAPYWILRLDENYQTALVGTPDRRYLWLLSRSAKIDEALYQSYLETAREQGYDLKELIINPEAF
ncbi:lipocalin family protein [Uruburuella testudinis]|uniref:Outer membrane lipoprotein Blc n=1 Tax=Uruburuella testudinis TaxID=1282863 RepID=A0ABY4DU24_9NEIS|nr:lipocalin family protein [Uruburuella testudinis]UOO82546.1 lipocalin family protein [Uruburuella testudinis]